MTEDALKSPDPGGPEATVVKTSGIVPMLTMGLAVWAIDQPFSSWQSS